MRKLRFIPLLAVLLFLALPAISQNTGTKAITIPGVIDITLTITAPTYPTFHVGKPYTSPALTASGGTAPYTWSVISGSLAPGLTLGSSTGIISGTPTALCNPNPCAVTIQAADSTTTATIQLQWNAPTAPVVGYNVYRGTQSGGPYVLAGSTPTIGFSEKVAKVAQSLFYVTTAVNASSKESALSNEAKAVVTP